jgi:hypothetical protein
VKKGGKKATVNDHIIIIGSQYENGPRSLFSCSLIALRARPRCWHFRVWMVLKKEERMGTGGPLSKILLLPARQQSRHMSEVADRWSRRRR